MNRRRRRLLRSSVYALGLPLAVACSPRRERVTAVPDSGFDANATAEEVTAGLDLAGRTVLITGCTSGIGFETMRVLASRGAYVLGTSRSLARAEAACRAVPGLTTPLELELANPASVLACADRVRSLESPLDILVCNAGWRGGTGERQLIDGIEQHFVANHLGHFLLVNRLLERLYLAWQGRIVVVASRAAYRDAPSAGIRFDDLALERGYSDALAYGQSKLANVLFANGLARRLRGTRITANSLHPGVIDTDIDENLGSASRLGFTLYTSLFGKSLAEGAATSCYVATSAELGAVSGRYFEDCNAVRVPGSFLEDTVMADELWALSEQLLGEHLVTPERPDWSEFENGTRRRDDGSG